MNWFACNSHISAKYIQVLEFKKWCPRINSVFVCMCLYAGRYVITVKIKQIDPFQKSLKLMYIILPIVLKNEGYSDTIAVELIKQSL